MSSQHAHSHSQSHSASDDHSTSDSQTQSNSHSHSHSQVPEINRIIIQSLIHQKLDEVRSGELYVAHDLKDDSVPKLLLEPAVYKKFESILAKTWMEIDMLRLDVHETGMNGGKLNKKKKLYTRALGGRDAREFVRGQIEDYIVLHLDRGGVGGVGPGRKDSDMDMQMEHEHGHEQIQHDHESSEEESDHANANADESDMENDTVSSLSDGKISRSSSKKRKKKKKTKKKRRKEKEREKERTRSRSKSRSSSSSSKSKSSSSKLRKSSSSKSSSKKRKRRESREEDKFDSDVEQMQEQEEVMDMPEEDMEDHVQELDDDEEDQEQIDDNSDDDDDEPQFTPRVQARYDRRIAKAQVIFERNRKDILQQIPEKSKREFRTLGFAKWGKDFLPVMVLGPYDVGPGGVRDQWMQMFENTIKSGRAMSKLVFWYGTPHDDLSNSFSFVAGSKIVSLPSGQKQHLHELPAKTQKKLESGKKLTATESMHVNGLKEFVEDVGRKPADRSEWLFEFQEDYEECLSGVEDDTSDEEGDMEDERRFDEEDNSKRKVKVDKNKKRKKEKSKVKEKSKNKDKEKLKLKDKEKLKQQRLKEKKKEELRIEKEQRKIEQQQQEQLERERKRLKEKVAKKKKKKEQKVMEEEEEDMKDSHYDAPSKKKSPSRKKKLKIMDESTLASPPKEKKKKKRKLEEQSSPVAAKSSPSKSKSSLSSPLPTASTTSVKPKTKKQKKSSKSLDEEIEAEVAEETQLMEEMRQDPPSEDDEDDGDFSVNGKEVSESDDEDADMDIDMEEEDLGYDDDDSVSLSRKKSKSTKKSKSNEKKKKKAPAVEKNEKATAKSKTTSSSAKKEKSAPVHQSPEEIREQELFEECEKIFIPIMSILVDPSSITATKAEKLMRKIDRDVHRLTPAFFRTHGIGLIVKGVRAHFKESNIAELNQLCKQLTANMKKVFHSKVGSEPKGFNPVTKKSVKAKKKTPAKTAATPKVKRDKSPVNVKQDREIGLDTSMASGKSSVSGSITIKELSIPQKSVIKEEVKISVESSSSIPKKGDLSSVKEEFKVKAKAAVIKQEAKKTPKPDKPKPARKSFSLAGMFAAPAAATPTPTASSSIEKSVDMDKSTHSSVEVKEEQPKWIVNYQPMGQQNTYESNPDREYAMEFLIEAANCFPEGRVDARSVARALEDALWTRYDRDLVKYMDRVHDICSAIAGKRQLGSLAQKIMSGDYSTPLDVINIPRKLLFQSFEGFWIP